MLIENDHLGFRARHLSYATAVVVKYRTLTLLLVLMLCQNRMDAQLKIGDNPTTIKAASLLEMESGNKGFVLPRVSITAVNSNAPLAPDLLEGTMVYNVNTTLPGGVGIYIWKAGSWQSVPISGSTGVTLNQAYNYGGAGAGRTIIANNGAVQVAGADGFEITGTYNTGTDMPNATGSRLFFSPKKAAFRAGYVSSTQWDWNNIGKYSTAFGQGSVASGENSLAGGWVSKAFGDNSVALGWNNSAIGNSSFAMGLSSIASGSFSAAFGYSNKAKSYGGTVIGVFNDTADMPTGDVPALTDRIFTIGNGVFNARSNAMTVLKNGNVGIGTTVPTARLELNGQLKITDGNQATGKVLMSDADGLATWTTPTVIPTTASNGLIKTGNNIVLGGALLATTDVPLSGYNFTLSGAGNVGIGIANPTAKLHVNSELKVTGGSSPQAISQLVDNFYEVSGTGPLGLGQSFTMPANATITEIDVYVFMSDVSAGTFALYQGAPGSGTPLITQPVTYNPTGVTKIILTTPIVISTAGTYSFSTGSNKRFKTSMSNTYTGGAMYWGTTANANSDMNFAVLYNLEGQTLYTSAAGNVGIGTASPTAKLELNGQLKITDGNEAAGKVLMSDANGLATWTTPTAGITGITLDQAYDFGGAGAGRTITATDGAVQIAGNDGFQVTGTYNSGADLSLSGAGTRMFFNPKKAAFRAGYTTAAKWDAANIGAYSFAAGYGTYASSTAAVAIGYGDSATGDYSLATGMNTRAIGDYSTAGGYATLASGDYSTAMGQNTTAAGSASTAMGYRSYAALPATVAIGYADSAKGNYSLALGANTKAVGYISTSLGQNTVATGNTAIAMGYRDSAKGDYSLAVGANTTAAGNYSTAMGTNTTALSYAETSIGSNNIAYTPLSATSWNAADRLFTIGNGTSAANQSNAVTVLKNGNMGIGNATPATRLDVTGAGRFTQSGGSLILAGTGAGSHTYVEFYTNGIAGGRTAWLGYGGNGSTSLSINNHGGSDIALSTPANFYFEANGANRLFVQGSNGFVGVGNTSPSAMLDVNGTTRLRGLTTAGVVTTDANGNLSSSAAASVNPVTASNGLTKTATDIVLGGALSASTTIAQGTNNLLFTGTGSMGIGTATPGVKLDVTGQGQFMFAGEGLRLAGTGTGSSTYTGFYPDGATGTRRAYLGYRTANNQNFTLENEYTTGDMSIATGQDLWVRTGGSNRMIVKGNSGNVGIGTVSPQRKLQVMGDGFGITQTNGTVEVGSYIGNGYGWLGTASNHNLAFFTNSGSPSVLLNTDGNLGIGTTTPQRKLQVMANGYGITQTNGAIEIGTYIDGNYGWLGTATNHPLAFFTNDGGVSMLLNTGGNVGIGTENPGARLEVAGQVKITGGIPGSGKILVSDANGLATWQTPETVTASNGLTKNGGDVMLGGTLSQTTSINNNGNNVLFTGTGNTGIGTSNPTALLDVASTFKVGGSSTTNTISQLTSSTTWNSANPTYGLSQTFYLPAGATITQIDVYSSSNATADFFVSMGAPGSNTVLTTQSVNYIAGAVTAIVLQNPVTAQVAGTYSFSTAIANLHLYCSLTNPYSDGEMYTNTGATGNFDLKFVVYYAQQAPALFVGSNGNIGIGTAGISGQKLSVSGNEFISGNLGVGTSNPPQKLGVAGSAYISDNLGLGISSPSQKLDVNGNARVSGNAFILGNLGVGTSAPGTNAKLEIVGGINKNPGSYRYMATSGEGGASGGGAYSLYTSNRIWCGEEINVTSDSRTKTNILSSNPAADLALINKLRVVDYNYKDKVTKGTTLIKGFVAQEVEQIMPNAVTQNKGVVPNIYQNASGLQYDANTKILRLTMPATTLIQPGDTVKLITEKGEQLVHVLAVQGNRFTVGNWQTNTQWAFVYGTQVNDLRNLDYNKLFSAGISAIQQLSKQNDDLEKENTAIRQDVDLLKAQMKALLERLNTMVKAGSVQ